MRLAFLAVVACLIAGAQAQPLDRARFEERLDWALENRLADIEQEVLRQRARAADAESGPRLFGTAGASEVRDVVTRDLVRSYPALSAQLGMRWPLYGSRDGEERNRKSAAAAIEQGERQRLAVRAETLHALRLAYVVALRRDQQVDLANAFLEQEAAGIRILAGRHEQRLLLEPDYREALSMFALVRRDRALLVDERGRARRRLAVMSGLRIDDELMPPAFSTACLSLEGILARRPEQAPIQRLVVRREERRQLLQSMGSVLPEAGLVFSQGVVQELGGQVGSTTFLGVDFRLPLAWRTAADARRAEALAELERAELALAQGEMQFEENARQAVEALQARRIGLDFADQRSAAALAQVETARLRLRLADGDVIEKFLQARLALYRAASEQIEARLLYERAQIDMLALVPECPPVPGDDRLQTTMGRVLKALVPLRVGAPEAPGGKPGWYAWAGGRWLRQADDPSWMDWLAVHADRIMLSFNAAEVADLTRPGEMAGRLERFLAQAHARGVGVDLLLGDPGWLAPAGRSGLLDLVRLLSGFHFDALNLDLERSQLPQAQQTDYPDWLLATVRDVVQVSPWPVSLSLHYREAASSALIEGLQGAGLSELCVMVYISKPERARRVMEPILRRHPGLPIAVAQSVEPGLERGESLASLGAHRARAALLKLGRDLGRFPNFAGVRVQSLEDFVGLAP